MTLDEARNAIDRKVVYRYPVPREQTTEEGVITSVNSVYVFVRYGSDQTSKATPAEWLTLL